MSTRLKIIFIATFFNLAFEFSFRGFGGMFIYGAFPVFLFLIYFSYFSIVEDLIRKYRITNPQLLLVAFAFGLFPITFLTKTVFSNPMIAGFNPWVLISVNIVWWGFIQGLLTFYLASRLVKRNWAEPLMGRGARFLAVAFLIGVHINKRNFVPGKAAAYALILGTFLILVLYLKKKLKEPQQEEYEVSRSPWLDLLAFGSVIVFILCGLLAGVPSYDAVSHSVISPLATAISTKWTQAVFFGMLGYYIARRRQITI